MSVRLLWYHPSLSAISSRVLRRAGSGRQRGRVNYRVNHGRGVAAAGAFDADRDQRTALEVDRHAEPALSRSAGGQSGQERGNGNRSSNITPARPFSQVCSACR
jgi:hypothetical protein